MRAATRAALDTAFESRSPIEPLPVNLQHKIGNYPVVLPPHRLFTWGNQEIQGLVHLVSIARAVEVQTVFEIGTYNGLTALTLAENLPSATVHTLDLPPGERPSLPLFPTDHAHIARSGARVYEGHPASRRIIQHLSDSASFDFEPFAGKVDLVYVDGAHSLPYLVNDTRQARIMASERGVIVWDDYSRQIPDVARFLEAVPARKLFRIPHTRLVVELSPAACAHLTGAGI